MKEVIVSMKNIVKTFPGVKALDNVNFELRSGEVMALLGEHGAGKSTLMKILSGVYTKDGGTMTIFGKEYDNLTPKQAQEVGVAIIHQELNMCRHLSVAENMFLGRERVGTVMLKNAEMEAEAAAILNDLKIDINQRQIVGELPVSRQQMVEIAKALSIHAKVLIMDEPTSALTAKEIDELFLIIRKLKGRLIISRQRSRRGCKTDSIDIISCFFRNTDNLVKFKSCITGSSCNLDDKYIPGNSPSVIVPLLRRRRKIIPYTHMSCLDAVCLTKFYCHVKV